MALLGMELSKKNSSLSEMSFLQSEVWKIWSEILGFNEIDLDDDLFRIGGDSIMAVQIFSAINKEFFVNLQIEKMFSSSCISIRWYSNLIEEYQIAQLGEEEYSNLIDQINMMSDQDINSILGVD